MEQARPVQEVVLVTGPAGAGRTTAIRALEDLGFEAIDNLPLLLLPRLIGGDPVGPLAVGVDLRTRGFSLEAMISTLEALEADLACALTLLYVDCAPRVLVQRFSETRRRHPLSPDGEPRLGIQREVALLAPLRDRAGVLVDTTAMTPHDLRAEMARHFGRSAADRLALSLVSFSYRRGAPGGLDMMLDVRFLRNPHWEAGLRPLDGRSAAVAAHVAGDPRWSPFMERLGEMLRLLLPAYRAEGRAYFTLGIGCTGGRHRSVAAVEALGRTLARDGWHVSIRHRDLGESTGGTQEARVEVGV